MTTQLDRSQFPKLAAYLDQLPNGVESHPDCTIKGAAARPFLDDKPLTSVPQGALPERLHALIMNPPARSSWVSDVENNCLHYAITDFYRMTEDAYLAWIEDKVQALFGGPVYRLMMSLASPEALLGSNLARWETFHNGSTLTTVEQKPKWVRRVLRFPEGLFDATGLRTQARIFEATLKHSRAKGASAKLVSFDKTSATFENSWT